MSLSIAVLIVGYTCLAHFQHKNNPADRTIPTWNQLWDGGVHLIQKSESHKSNEADLLAAAMEGMGIESEASSQTSEGFLQGRILWEASKATLSRLFAGLGVGMLGGIIVGVFMGCFLKLDASLSPVMYFFSRIIPTAAMPIFFKMAGIDFEMYV
ncbi:MAG: hypothetical protein AAF558_10930, partial [Verrucomicrobiota bacterium]